MSEIDTFYLIAGFIALMSILVWRIWRGAQNSSHEESRSNLILFGVIPYLLTLGAIYIIGRRSAEILIGDEFKFKEQVAQMAGFAAALIFLYSSRTAAKILKRGFTPPHVRERENALPAGSANFYIVDADEGVENRGVMIKQQALDHVEKIISSVYGNPDVVNAEAHFGFLKRPEYFIEISVIDEKFGSFIWVENDDKLFMRKFEIVNARKDAVMTSVEKFFDFDVDSFLDFFQGIGARKA